MKHLLLLTLLLSSLNLFGQEKTKTATVPNYFKFGAQFGGGFGLKKMEVIDYDEFDNNGNVTSSGTATISGGGGIDFDITTEYIIKGSFSIGSNFGVQLSQLSEEIEDASVNFSRLSIRPTVKYLIPLNKLRSNTLNFGVGYGIYLNNKMKFDVDGAKFKNEYDNASGFHVLTEWEWYGPTGFGLIIGAKYTGVNYQIKRRIGDIDFDNLQGNSIGFYVGMNYRFNTKKEPKAIEK